MDEMPALKLLFPDGRQRILPIEADPFLIGRRRDNHLVLAGNDISRVQAILRRTDEGWVIEDQESLYGTTVNGEAVQTRVLKNRDVVAFGRERLLEIMFLHNDPMSRILGEVDRNPVRETSRDEMRNLRILLEITKGMNALSALSDLLDLALDAVIDLTKAERGFLMLKDSEGRLQMQAARNLAGERIRPENLRISMSIVGDVMAGGSSVFLTDAQQRSDLRDRSSISELNLRAIACLPIKIPAAHMLTRQRRRISLPGRSGISDEVLGVIYTDSSQAARPIDEVSRDLVHSIAAQAAVTIENFLLRQEELEHRLMEKEMEKLREVDRLKSDFVSHVSHELRTPLTAIKGSIDNMLDGLTGPLSERQAHYLQRMKENTDHLVRLISDLLDLSRIEAGQISIIPRPLSLPRLMTEICESIRSIATARRIALDVEAPAELTLTADRDRVVQILLNLVGNALKFTPSGGHVLLSAEASGERALLRVKDDGPGFDPGEAGKVFERFYRVSPADGEPVHGTGLGLSITKSLVELHGGSIQVETSLGGGTTFTVALPIAGPQPPAGEPAGPAPASGAPVPGAHGTPRASQG